MSSPTPFPEQPKGLFFPNQLNGLSLPVTDNSTLYDAFAQLLLKKSG